MAGPKPMRTEFDIHQRLESCVICFHEPTYTNIALLIELSLDTKTEKVETAIQNNNRILKLRTTEGSLGNYPGSKYSCNVS